LFFERPDSGEVAVLVHIHFPDEKDREDPGEFLELVRSAGADPVALIEGSRSHPSPKFFVGDGKLEEIRQAVAEHEAEVVLFNHSLSPSQERNVEQALQCRVLDRTGLILDIFAQRARTHEGKLQVELAQLLGSEDFMSTGDAGTSPQKLMDGVARYLESTDEQGALSYKGNRKVSGRYNPERTAEVSPEWLMAGIEKKQHIWLNIGWYQRLSNGELVRKGGHWVTLVGYERFGTGADGVKDSLLINDPATQLEASEVINYQPLGQQVVRNKQGQTFKIGTGFSLSERQNPPKFGQVITYKYFGLTRTGKPKFASFLRVKERL